MRVLAALSGGVDSAVAAARMVDTGHRVVGVHLALSRTPAATRSGSRGCCSAQDARDAARVADLLGIDFHVWDVSRRFAADVVDDFVAEYAAGRTPHPCLRCNEKIKFSAVLDRALALGFDAVATGHYARIAVADDGTRALHRAADPAKDQSYVLGVLDARQLAHAVFPLGDSVKADVRAEAARRGLLVADKPDSHDICFIPDGDTAGFLRARIPDAPGEIVDQAGEPVGAHTGTSWFTVGQRRGLSLDRPAADGQPRYVLAISPVQRRVTVGPRASLGVRSLVGSGARWAGGTPQSDGTSFAALAQIRAHAPAVPAVATVTGDRVQVAFAEPVAAVAPGQAVVLFDGDRVLGSATIDATQA